MECDQAKMISLPEEELTTARESSSVSEQRESDRENCEGKKSAYRVSERAGRKGL
jgi:hypothetical protein